MIIIFNLIISLLLLRLFHTLVSFSQQTAQDSERQQRQWQRNGRWDGGAIMMRGIEITVDGGGCGQ